MREIAFTIEEYLQQAEELEIKLLDLIINYYKGVLSKGCEIIKTKTVISDLEEIKKQFIGSDEELEILNGIYVED